MTAWNSANGLRNVDGYDSDMRPSGIRVPNLQSWDYGYDTANRLTTMTDNLDGTLTQTLGYDELDRLKTVASTADNESYNYDASGNRTSQTVNGVTTTFGIDPTSNRVTSETSGSATNNYKYDPEGSLYGYGPGNPSQMFYYTAFERLNGSYVAGLSAHFDVNPEGQRLRKYTSLDSTWFAPDPGGTLEAEDQDGTWADYVWLNGKLVAMIRNNNVYSVHTDQAGRAEGMTNSQGNIIWRAKNFAFDRQVTAGQSSGFNLGFPGQYFDDEDDLWYNGNRDYDATLGRYIESDPIGLQGGINTYAYVGNNPISNVDPLGLMPPALTLALERSALTDLAGGGPEDPFGDIAAVGVFAGTLIVSAYSESAMYSGRPPPGSLPIDQTPWSGDHGQIKGALGLGGTGKVFIDPEGNVWVENPDGSWTNEGPARNFTGSGEPSGKKGKDRDGCP